jgi:ribosomal protein L44E
MRAVVYCKHGWLPGYCVQCDPPEEEEIKRFEAENKRLREEDDRHVKAVEACYHVQRDMTATIDELRATLAAKDKTVIAPLVTEKAVKVEAEPVDDWETKGCKHGYLAYSCTRCVEEKTMYDLAAAVDAWADKYNGLKTRYDELVQEKRQNGCAADFADNLRLLAEQKYDRLLQAVRDEIRNCDNYPNFEDRSNASVRSLLQDILCTT